MATLAVEAVPARARGRRSIFDWVPDGVVNDIFFRALLLTAPIQSILILPVQGSVPAFVLALLSPILLLSSDIRHIKLVAFYAGFIILYALFMACSLSGFLIDEPDMSKLLVIREIYVFGMLKQTHITQGSYLLAALIFAFLVYQHFQEAFVKYAFYGVLFLTTYGFYEFAFFAILNSNGDFLSNRNFGDLSTAASGAGNSLAVSGSRLQPSTLFGPAFMRLKSLTGEPSMYALSVTPFAVYAYGRRWWWIAVILALSLLLSTSSTAVIGLLIGIVYIESRQRQQAILYVPALLFCVLALYLTSSGLQNFIDNLIFNKLDTVSGNDRSQFFWSHARVPFDGNPVRFLFGLGFGSVRSTDMLSNLLANSGLIGVTLYSVAILLPCLLLRKGGDSNALIGTLLSIYVMEMATVSEYSYLPPWFMVAMAYARARDQRQTPLIAKVA